VAGPDRASTLVIGCGALGRELAQLVARDGLDHVDVRCLPASLHNRPERIAPAVDGLVRAAQGRYERIFVAYGDCGTGGGLDRVLAATSVSFDVSVAEKTMVLMAMFPGSFVLSFAYTEALLLTLAGGCFWFLLRRQWLAAGVLAALGTATRPNGLALVAAGLPAYYLWRRR